MPNFILPSELIDRLNRHDCVLFVGDQFNLGELQQMRLAGALTDSVGLHALCQIQVCKDSNRCQRPQNCSIRWAEAAQVCEARSSSQELRKFLLQRPRPEIPDALYQAIVALNAPIIITTAYDDQLELALQQGGYLYRVVLDDIDIPFSDPDYVQVIRLYGTISRPDSLVLTDDDAADLYTRLSPVTQIILQAHLASSTLFFIGYDFKDLYFRALYRRITRPIERVKRTSYAIQWPQDDDAVAGWRDQITFIHAEPLSFLNQLKAALQLTEKKLVQRQLPPEPYKFLDSYTEQDAAVFFGRDLEADLLLGNILTRRLNILYGRSGTGKTSLLQARLIPQLQAKGYMVVYARMLGDPINEIKAAQRNIKLSELTSDDLDSQLYSFLTGNISSEGRLVVILDQFEEFFVRQGEQVRHNFARELANCLLLASQSEVDIRFLFSLRDDYLGRLDELSSFLPQDVFTHRYRLDNLTREKAELAIIKPANAFGLPVEEELSQRLLDDLEEDGLETTSLQIVLYQIYRDAVSQKLWNPTIKHGAGLTLQRYIALGAVPEILANYLEQVLAEMSDDDQRQIARLILKSMVTSEKTKAVITRKEIANHDLLQHSNLSEETITPILDKLRQARVVRKFGEEERYELAHDVLVKKVWGWVTEDEQRLFDVRQMLLGELDTYRKLKHLLSAEKLAIVSFYRSSLHLSPVDEEFILRSALKNGDSSWNKKVAKATYQRVLQELQTDVTNKDRQLRQEAWQKLWLVRESLPIPLFLRALFEHFGNLVRTSPRSVIGALSFVFLVFLGVGIMLMLVQGGVDWRISTGLIQGCGIGLSQKESSLVAVNSVSNIYVIDPARKLLCLSNDSGGSWVQLVAKLPPGILGMAASNDVVYMVNTKKIYTLGKQGVLYDENLPANYKDNQIVGIAADPLNPDVVYIGLQPDKQIEPVPVILTRSSAAASWKPIKTDSIKGILKAISANEMTIAVATDQGLWASVNNGDKWTELGGLKSLKIFALTVPKGSENQLWVWLSDGGLYHGLVGGGNSSIGEPTFQSSFNFESGRSMAITENSYYLGTSYGLICKQTWSMYQPEWWRWWLGINPPCG